MVYFVEDASKGLENDPKSTHLRYVSLCMINASPSISNKIDVCYALQGDQDTSGDALQCKRVITLIYLTLITSGHFIDRY